MYDAFFGTGRLLHSTGYAKSMLFKSMGQLPAIDEISSNSFA
jgi:hypothetical protein